MSKNVVNPSWNQFKETLAYLWLEKKKRQRERKGKGKGRGEGKEKENVYFGIPTRQTLCEAISGRVKLYNRCFKGDRNDFSARTTKNSRSTHFLQTWTTHRLFHTSNSWQGFGISQSRSLLDDHFERFRH